MGGRGGGRLPTLPCRNPAGACLFGRLPTFCFSFVSAPIPPTPFPAGRGRIIVFLCKGLRPLHPRGLTRAAQAFLVESEFRRGLRLLRGGVGVALRCPEGGAGGWSPADLALPKPGGGLAFLVACLPFYFSLLSFPHPPDPLPGGKGETKGFFMQGASPLASPGLNPGGTGFSCGKRVPLVITAVQGIQSLAGLDAALVSNGGSQGEGGPGERNFGV